MVHQFPLPAAELPKAAHALQFAVVGGGIAGLAAAWALKLAGHEIVAVMEKSNGAFKSRGCIQSTPGMTRTLLRWGFAPELRQYAHKCGMLIFRNGLSNQLIGRLRIDQDFRGDILTELLFIQHQDLCNLLRARLHAVGVPLLYNTSVSNITTSAEGATLALSTGHMLEADIVIAADGWYSSLRQHVAPDMPTVLEVVAEEQGSASAMVENVLHLTFTVPTDTLAQDNELRFLTDQTLWPVWMGQGYAVHMNITTDGNLLTATMTYDYDGEPHVEDAEYMDRPITDFQLDMDKFCPPLRRLLSVVDTISARVVTNRPVAEDLVCRDSRIVLVGDAAHPLLPARPSLAIEDAETLRAIFLRMTKPTQRPLFLNVYEELRQPYCEGVIAYDRTLHNFVRTEPGASMDERDALLRASMAHGGWDNIDEAPFPAQWEAELRMYTFDAMEHVESHWTHWGRYMLGEAMDKVKKGKRGAPSQQSFSGIIKSYVKAGMISSPLLLFI
ncbi:hypothetical protein HYPSUDRAFT_60210 [Hypholoma sublateritium FD-334 SS-4]|uniref:FAD-binding domain-containing protein n=1 Tax=Hypholoma sublateritium (strain FD-334 SS-4) TaxID=945553 RepID=A0A0D2N0V7_HYPSF|nr:hypothetical protein HYPSUDRAFT_60210 [Hypholoma sublateritium FD-334 SS-4]